MTAQAIALFIASAIAETGGAYLVWIAIKEHSRGAASRALLELAAASATRALARQLFR